MAAISKQLLKVLLERASNDFVKMIMVDRMDMVVIGVSFSKAKISLRTASEQYLMFKAWITPWSIGWVGDVVIESKNINSIHLRYSTYRWAVQFLIIKMILLLAEPNFQSSSLTQSS